MLGYNKNMAPLIQSHAASNHQSFGIKSNSIPWTEQEDNILIRLHNIHGSNWELIARHLNSSNESQNFYLDRSPSEVQQRFETMLRPYGHRNHFSRNENCSLSSSILSDSSNTMKHTTKYKLTPSFQSSYNTELTGPNSFGLKNLNSTTNGASNLKLRLPDSLNVQTSSMKQRKLNSDNCDSVRSNIITCLPISFPSSSPSFCAPKDMLLANPKPINKTRLFTTDSSQLTSSLSPNPYHQPTRSLQLNPNNNQLRSHKSNSPSTLATTPTNGSLLVDSSYLVQTPTKALSEADQFSFHLASPPAVLGTNLVTGTNSSRTSKTTKLDSNRTPVKRFLSKEFKGLTARPTLGTRLFDNPSQSSTKHNLCTTKPLSQLPSSLPTSMPGSFSRSVSSSSSLRLTEPSDSKCLALLTAKATVWNRVFSSLPTSERSAYHSNSKSISSTSHLTDPYFGGMQRYPDMFSGDRLHNPAAMGGAESMISNSLLRPREPLKPLVALNVPSRQQPHLALRRVLQIGHEDNWRELALGNNRTRLSVVRSARLFLDEYNAMDRDLEPPVKRSSDYHQPSSNHSPTLQRKKDFIKPEPS